MVNSKGILISFNLLLICGSLVVAQNEPVARLFTQYIESIDALNETKNITTVEKFLSDNFMINETYVGLKGEVIRSSKDLTTFLSGLSGIVNNENIKVDMSIIDITNVDQGESKATISANLNMYLQSEADGQIIEEDGFAVTMIAVKDDQTGQWQFVHSNNIRTVEERNAGNCSCYFYSREDRFITELIYPAGLEYKKHLNVFGVKGDGNNRIIISDNGDYQWGANGELWELSTKTRVGTTKDEKEAVTMILGRMYGGNCLKFQIL